MWKTLFSSKWLGTSLTSARLILQLGTNPAFQTGISFERRLTNRAGIYRWSSHISKRVLCNLAILVGLFWRVSGFSIYMKDGSWPIVACRRWIELKRDLLEWRSKGQRREKNLFSSNSSLTFLFSMWNEYMLAWKWVRFIFTPPLHFALYFLLLLPRGGRVVFIEYSCVRHRTLSFLLTKSIDLRGRLVAHRTCPYRTRQLLSTRFSIRYYLRCEMLQYFLSLKHNYNFF